MRDGGTGVLHSFTEPVRFHCVSLFTESSHYFTLPVNITVTPLHCTLLYKHVETKWVKEGEKVSKLGGEQGVGSMKGRDLDCPGVRSELKRTTLLLTDTQLLWTRVGETLAAGPLLGL